MLCGPERSAAPFSASYLLGHGQGFLIFTLHKTTYSLFASSSTGATPFPPLTQIPFDAYSTTSCFLSHLMHQAAPLWGGREPPGMPGVLLSLCIQVRALHPL